MNDKVMLYMLSTDSMSGPFYATFENGNLVLVWAVQTVKNDIIVEDTEYAGNGIYYTGKETLVLLDYVVGKNFSAYRVEASEKIAT